MAIVDITDNFYLRQEEVPINLEKIKNKYMNLLYK